jgi:hypothetical protein
MIQMKLSPMQRVGLLPVLVDGGTVLKTIQAW